MKRKTFNDFAYIMYRLFVSKIPFTKQEIIDELKISEDTFKRYICDIRNFLSEYYTNYYLIWDFDKGYFIE
ncbi:MAG: hypothetical protein FWE02_07500 [Defluviitaleaceae bacterium]|nr:hypothetical protein [Defluviitaleaceae bacterium]